MIDQRDQYAATHQLPRITGTRLRILPTQPMSSAPGRIKNPKRLFFPPPGNPRPCHGSRHSALNQTVGFRYQVNRPVGGVRLPGNRTPPSIRPFFLQVIQYLSDHDGVLGAGHSHSIVAGGFPEMS